MAEDTEKTFGDHLSETVRTVFWALVIAGVFRTLFFQPFWIPSGSMKDTLLIGDFLFVNKMAYGYSRYSCPFSMCPFTGRILERLPERGDVVVFRHPSPLDNSDFIKRVIGLPGDRIKVENGVVSINGEFAVQMPAGTFEEVYERQGPLGHTPRCSNGPLREGDICQKERFTEALPGGPVHDVLNIGTYPQDNTEYYTVGPGELFVMGDNRDNSTDSRFTFAEGGVQKVPVENLIGRADRIIFSSGGRRLLYFWAWRADRFFKAIE